MSNFKWLKTELKNVFKPEMYFCFGQAMFPRVGTEFDTPAVNCNNHPPVEDAQGRVSERASGEELAAAGAS